MDSMFRFPYQFNKWSENYSRAKLNRLELRLK